MVEPYRRQAERLETIEDVDAAANAITDDRITAQLHELYARALLARLAERDGRPLSAEPDARGPEALDITHVEELADAVDALRRQLHAVYSEVNQARIRRDNLMRDVATAERRLAQARSELATVSPGAAAYLGAVGERAQEVLDEAISTAKEVVAVAVARAESIRDRADYRARYLAETSWKNAEGSH